MTDEERRAKRNAYQREYARANRQRTTEIQRASKAKKADEYRAADRARYERNKEQVKERARAHYAANSAKKIAYQKVYQRENRDALAQAARARAARNREKLRKRMRERWAAADKATREAKLAKSREAHHANRELRLKQKRAWSAGNPEKGANYAANRRAARLQATPSWANQFFISEAYHLAKLRSALTGFAWEVDHAVPLVSEFVCGLHVENNLRVVPRVVNRSKSNRHWPDMP